MPKNTKEWETEPDHVFFTHKNFLCEIKRNDFLSLCGYVYIPKTHSLYRKHYDDIDVRVHGGLTFSDMVLDQWCIGFDCGHAGDLAPAMKTLFRSPLYHDKDVYRNVKYVNDELVQLVDQIIKDYTSEEELERYKDTIRSDIAHALLSDPQAAYLDTLGNARMT